MLFTKIYIEKNVNVIFEKRPNHKGFLSPVLSSIDNITTDRKNAIRALLLDPRKELYEEVFESIDNLPIVSNYISSTQYNFSEIHIKNIIKKMSSYAIDADNFDILLIDFSWEAFNFKFAEYFMESFNQEIFPFSKKSIFITSSANHNDVNNFFYADSFFEPHSYVQFLQNPKIISSNKIKRFISLNRKHRPLRIEFLQKLYDNDLVDNFLLSHPEFGCYKEKNLDISVKFIPPHIKNVPWVEGGLHPDIQFQPANYDLFGKSYFNVITESLIESESNTVFITEKIFKSIYAKMPFILYGVAGTLNSLKEMGYKTYENIIDESYDKEKNDLSRLDLIIKEIKRLAELSAEDFLELYQKTIAITEWNYQNYIKRNSENIIGKKVIDYLYNRCYNNYS